MNLEFTAHAKHRLRQRGSNHQTISIIVSLADRTSYMGGGLIYLYLTQRRINELRETGLLLSVCEQLSRTSLLMDPETGEIVTILKGGRGARGLKRYRRGQWFHQRRPANDNRRGRGNSRAA